MRWFANKKSAFALFLAFLIPVLLFGIVLLISRLCGNNVVMVFCDAQYQYVEFLLYFRQTILGGESMFYSFNMAGGTEMLPLFAYYCLSPLNLIVCLFPESAVMYAFCTIVILKIGLSGLTFYIFAKEFFGKRLSLPVLLTCSTAYALSGFVVMYFWQMMWMDAVLILPIVALSIKRLVQGRGILMYVLALFYGIVTNYYIGFMLCIFAVLWFIYLRKTSGTLRFMQAVRKFIFGSLIAGGMAAIVLVPTVIYMLNSGVVGRSNAGMPQNSLVLETMTQLLTGTITGTKHYVTGPPQIFIGLPLFIFTIMYFMNRKITRKERWLSAGLLLVLFLSFENGAMNSFWHLGSTEMWFPHRFAFLASFVMIYLAMRNLESWQRQSVGRITFMATLVFMLIIFTGSCINYNDEFLVRCFEVVTLLIVTGILIIVGNKMKYQVRTWMVVTVILLEGIGLIVNGLMANQYLSLRDRKLVITNENEFSNSLNESEQYRNEFRNSLYNDGIMKNELSMGSFSSTNSLKWLNYLTTLGLTRGDTTKIQFTNGTTNLIEDLLAIKSVDGVLNEDVWPMMTVVNEQVREVSPTALESALVRPFEFYNRAFMAMADGGKVYYLYGTADVSGKVYCVGDLMKNDGGREGWIHNHDVMECDGKFSRVGDEAYIEDAVAVARYHELVPGVELSRKGAELSGEVTINDSGKMLMLSLPYSKGWTAYIDGVPVQAEKVLGGFLGFPVSTGQHKVVLKFMPVGFNVGALISVGSVIILIGYGIMAKRSFYGKSKSRK